MADSIVLALVTFALAAAFAPWWLRFLQSQRMGKQMNPSEPEQNKAKEGTPTMGGVVIVAPIVAVGLAFQALVGGRLIMLVPLALAVGLSVLGGLDDLQTLLRQKRSVGISPVTKLGVQGVLSLAAAIALAWNGMTQVHVPFVGAFVLPAWAYVPFAAFVTVATVNSVAITDGLDSLAATTAGIAFLAFWIVGLTLGYPLSASLSATCVGALLAYLWFNAYPAQMWMGDVGAQALGGLLAMVALIEREPFLLLPIGIIFVANATSNILQVLSVKLRGRRLFRIAPLHNHFQRVGWPEVWIVQRFWIVGAVGALVGVLVAVRA
jgi:phospho-N-acetylmuramoyl-pentapeptide-transferase